MKKILVLLLTAIIIEPASVAAVEPPTAISVLNKLEVKGRAAKTSYARSQFPHWSDPDRNGCDSRNDVLKRDLKVISFKDGTRDCKVISGELVDPFSGKKIRFDLNTSVSNIDIDHIYLKYKEKFSLKDSREFLLLIVKLKNINLNK